MGITDRLRDDGGEDGRQWPRWRQARFALFVQREQEGRADIEQVKIMEIPEGYQQVMPYLIVKDAARFMDFMKNVFSAEEKLRIMRDENTIMHAEIKIGDSVIMLADATSQFAARSAALFVYVEDADGTYNKAIAEGATSIMPISDKEYGRGGGVTDPFGNVWWPTTPPGKGIRRKD